MSIKTHKPDMSFEEFMLLGISETDYVQSLKSDRFQLSEIKERLKRAEEYVEKLKNLSEEEAQEMMDRVYGDLKAEANRKIKQKKEEKFAYEKILNRVLLWEPPTEKHEVFKEEMVKKLEGIIEFKCNAYTWHKIIKEEPSSVDEWLEKEIEKHESIVEWFSKKVSESEKRIKESSEWILGAIESLDVKESDIEEYIEVKLKTK